MFEDEAEQKAEALLHKVADMGWGNGVDAVASALKEAWQQGHDAADGEPYTDREKHLAEIAKLKAGK